MNLRAFILLAGILLAVPHTGRADEFAVVPAGDPMYTQLATITRAGWLSTSPSTLATAKTPHQLTRYEIALETAKAIFMVKARQRADSNWAATAPRPALRALREMTAALRAELKELDVDATSTLAFFDGLLKPATTIPSRAPLAVSPGVRNPVLPSVGNRTPVGSASALLNGLNLGTRSVVTRTSMAEIPLSQRLRLTTTLMALARDADHPEGPAAGSRISRPTVPSLNPGAVTAGAKLDLTNWLTLRAEYHRRLLEPTPLSSRLDPFGSLSENRMGGGVDISLLHGLTVTGNLAKVSSDAETGLDGTRLEGGLGFTAWQDRVSLTANLSRLVPEDSMALSTTAAGLNLDVDVTERLSLSLLYKQLFGPQNPAQAERFVGGGISINF